MAIHWAEHINPFGRSTWWGSHEHHGYSKYRLEQDSTCGYKWYVLERAENPGDNQRRWGPFDFAEEAKKFVETLVTLQGATNG